MPATQSPAAVSMASERSQRATERTVGARQYGQFMVDIFEEWVRHDVGQVYVQLFDVTLEAFFGRHMLCIHAPTCGYGPALEHNGDLYSCDHFVEPDYKLGNIHETHMLKLVASPEQRRFGDDKRDTLTAQCRSMRASQEHDVVLLLTVLRLHLQRDGLADEVHRAQRQPQPDGHRDPDRLAHAHQAVGHRLEDGRQEQRGGGHGLVELVLLLQE